MLSVHTMNEVEVFPQDPVISTNGICSFCGRHDMKIMGIYSEEGLQNDLPEKIKLYLPIKTSNFQDIQMNSCWDCVSIILSWHKFVQKVLETTHLLDSSLREKHRLTSDDAAIIKEGDVPLQNSSTQYACPSIYNKNCQNGTTQNNLQLDSEQSEEKEKESDNYLDTDMDIPNYNVEIENEQEKQNSPEQNPEEITYVCHFCPEIFPSEEEVLNHTNLTHPDVGSDDVTESKSNNKPKRMRTKIDPKVINAAKVVVDDRVYYNCKECGKSLLSPYTFVWHMRIHTGERPFCCDLCGKKFRVSQGLVRHLKETHERIKNFPCDLCGRMFASKRNVEEHRRIHTNERPYICALCGKAFKQKASLFVHNRTHSDTFPYKCDYCNQGFRSKPPLLIHVTKHTGQKPYPCDVCGRCFRIKYELKRHRLVHSEEKPFCCSFCGLKFKQKRYLRNHFKANHLSNISISGSLSVL